MLGFHCVICLNSQETGDITDGFSQEEELAPMSTICGHIFHQKCLAQWIATRVFQQEFYVDGDEFEVSCPMCNVIIDEDDCIRLYPQQPEPGLVEQSTQTTLDKPELRIPDYAGLLSFTKRKLREKWAAEREVQRLQECLQKQNLDLERMRVMLANTGFQSTGCTCGDYGARNKKSKVQKTKNFVVRGFRAFLNPGEFHPHRS